MPWRPPRPCPNPTCGALHRTTEPCPRCGRPPSTASAAQRGYDAGWRKLSAAVIARDGGVCRLGIKCDGAPARTTDHVIPKSEGGTDDPANLVAACRPCNSAKGPR